MLLTAEYIDPAELTGYVRAALADYNANRFTLSQFLPDRVVDDLEYRFAAGQQGLADAASFRAYDTEAEIAGRPGIKRVTGELPPISRKMRSGEFDRLRFRQLSDQEQQALGLMSDAERLTRSIAARMELAKGDALVNGSVTISENGVEGTIDFDRPSAAVVTVANAWDTDSGDPINDLTAAVLAYNELNGVDPGAIVLSRRIVAALIRNDNLRKSAGTLIGVSNIISQSAVSQLFEAFSLPPFQTYDAQVLVDGTATRVTPDDIVLMLPAPVAPASWEDTELGATFWGTTAESLEPNYGIELGDAPGIVAGVYSTEDPVALWTKAAAIAVPVVANPSLAWKLDGILS